MGSVENETSEEFSGNKSKFLILGGCGFIGRHLVTYLADKAERIFVIDKTPPELVWLTPAQQQVFSSETVVFRSANLITQAGCEKAFESIDPDIDYVINLASETRKGQSEPVYLEGIYKLSANVIQQVSKLSSVKTFVHFSTSQVYGDGKSPHKESDKVDLWNYETRFNFAVEEELEKNLRNFVIVRPAIVYGPGDRTGITPRLVVGGIYKHLRETMKLPWTEDTKTHTVHVADLVRATCFLCHRGRHGEVYNVVDMGDTTQGAVTNIVSSIFRIKHDYWGTTFSTLAKLDLTDIVEEINDKHMGPWAALCAEDGVPNTPLTPYIHPSSLMKKHMSVSGSKLMEEGFTDFKYPSVTKEVLLEILDEFIQLGMFPKSLLQN